MGPAIVAAIGVFAGAPAQAVDGPVPPPVAASVTDADAGRPPEPSPSADASGWSLVWAAPESCPDEAAFRSQVQALGAARDDATQPLRPLQVVATIVDRDHDVSLRLELADPYGETEYRTLIADTCAHAVDAGALVVALALRPQAAVSTARVPEPAPIPEDDVSTAPADVEPFEPEFDRSTPAPARPEPWAFDLGVGGGAHYGLAPGFTTRFVVGFGVERKALRWQAALGAWVPKVAGEDPATAAIDVWDAHLGACGRPQRLQGFVALCGGLWGGTTRARPQRALGDRPNAVAAHLSPGLEVRLAATSAAGLRFAFVLEGRVPVLVPRFQTVDPTDGSAAATVFGSAPLAATATLQLSWVWSSRSGRKPDNP